MVFTLLLRDKKAKILISIIFHLIFQNLGQFLTTFAQLRILGLAYDYRLELFITNAADQEFRQKFDAKMLLYSNQPNSEIILRNYEAYEKMFEESITKYAALSALSLNFDGGKDEKVNVDAFLATLINSDVKSARLSITSDSDDGGISKISDFPYKYYVYHQKPVKSGTASTSPHLNNHPLDENNPLTRFFKYCSPLKNNFLNSSLANNYEYSDDDNDLMFNKERGGLFWGALLGSGKGDRSKSFADSNSSSGDFKRRRTLFSLMNGLNIKDDNTSNTSNNNSNNNNDDLDDDLDYDKDKISSSTDSGIQDGASTVTNKSVDDLSKICLDVDGKTAFDENKNLSELKVGENF